MKNAWSWTQWGGLKGEEIEFEGKQMVLPPGKALWRPLITEEFSNITETSGNYMDRFKYNFLTEPYEGESLPFLPISNLNEIWQPPDEWLDKGDLNERLREEKACVIVEKVEEKKEKVEFNFGGRKFCKDCVFAKLIRREERKDRYDCFSGYYQEVKKCQLNLLNEKGDCDYWCNDESKREEILGRRFEIIEIIEKEETNKNKKEEEFSMIDIFDNTGGEYPPYPPEEEDKTREPQVEDPEDFGGSK